MIDRRELLTLGGLLGGMASAAPAADAAADAGAQMSDRYAQDTVDALKSIRDLVRAQQSFAELAGVRKSQFDYLRAQGKFPDFIDVALDVWMGVYDWHVRMQQPLMLGRDASGRYTLGLAFTALVLRQDAAAGFIGIPFDNR